MKSTLSQTLHKQSLAMELIRRNARISIIEKATGLSSRLLQASYLEFHGFSATSGRSKQSARGLTRTMKRYKETTLFAVCYRTTEYKIDETEIQKAIIAFDAFKKIYPTSQLDFSGAWVIVQDLKELKFVFSKCFQCQSTVLLHNPASQSDRCFVCNIRLLKR
jgi:hypothetical protein